MRVGMYKVREQLVHLAEGRFSLTGGGRWLTTEIYGSNITYLWPQVSAMARTVPLT